MQGTAFSIVVVITLGLIGFFGVVVWQPELFAALLGRATAGHVGEHFRENHHRVHDLTFSFLLGTPLVGMLAQVRAPTKNVAGLLMAVMPFVAMLFVVVLTNTAVLSIPWMVVGASTLLAATLHPTGRDLFRSFTTSRLDRVMLALVAIAAVPLLALASANIGLQRTAADDHAALGHYGYMASFSLAVIGVGVLASLRPDGWRLTAWVGGVLPVLLGLTSVVFPDVASSLGLAWALAAVAWGVAFVAAAARTQATDMAGTPISPAKPTTASDSTEDRPPASRSVIAAGIIVIVLVLLFVVMHLTGGGPGIHAPPASISENGVQH